MLNKYITKEIDNWTTISFFLNNIYLKTSGIHEQPTKWLSEHVSRSHGTWGSSTYESAICLIVDKRASLHDILTSISSIELLDPDVPLKCPFYDMVKQQAPSPHSLHSVVLTGPLSIVGTAWRMSSWHQYTSSYVHDLCGPNVSRVWSLIRYFFNVRTQLWLRHLKIGPLITDLWRNNLYLMFQKN